MPVNAEPMGACGGWSGASCGGTGGGALKRASTCPSGMCYPESMPALSKLDMARIRTDLKKAHSSFSPSNLTYQSPSKILRKHFQSQFVREASIILEEQGDTPPMPPLSSR